MFKENREKGNNDLEAGGEMWHTAHVDLSNKGAVVVPTSVLYRQAYSGRTTLN